MQELGAREASSDPHFIPRRPCLLYTVSMILEQIEAIGFRNLQGSSEFSPDLNIFYGDNAQGKTSWLEAIYVLGNTKSFRTKQLRDVLAFDAQAGPGGCIVRGRSVRGGLSKQIQVAVTDQSRELYVNGKREAVTRYLGNLDVFVFSMEEIGIIRGEPSERRRFLDRGIVAVTPSYLGTLAEYNQVIRQKNRLLAQAAETGSSERYRRQLEAWNDQLVELGAAIHEARTGYVERLNQALDRNDHGHAIFAAERVSLRYRSCLEGKGDLDRYLELFRERLGLRMEAEMAAGHSLVGPHRDELEITADSREIARYGSAGQQKSALFILDLAQISIYNYVYEESPVLLIDDIDAELDRGRIEAVLIELEGKIQTFVSTSRRGIANRYRDRANIYTVERGAAVRECSEAAGRAAGHNATQGIDAPRSVEQRSMIAEESDANIML